MSEPQPELRWAPIPPKPRRAGRIWLIVGLALAAVLITALLLFLLIPRDGSPTEPTPSPSTSRTPTSSPTATPTSAPTPSSSATPEPTPVDTPPPAVDPTVEAFAGQVGPRLDDALTGLDIVSDASGQDAVSVIDTLREDAQRLSDALPPSSIAQGWRDGVSDYSQKLSSLRSVAAAGTSTKDAVAAAQAAVESLDALIGR